MAVVVKKNPKEELYVKNFNTTWKENMRRLAEMSKYFAGSYTLQNIFRDGDDFIIHAIPDTSVFEKRLCEKYFGGKRRHQIHTKYKLGNLNNEVIHGSVSLVSEYLKELYDKWQAGVLNEGTSIGDIEEMLSEMSVYYNQGKRAEYGIDLHAHPYAYTSVAGPSGTEQYGTTTLEDAIADDLFGGNKRGRILSKFDKISSTGSPAYPSHTTKEGIDEYWTYLYNAWVEKHKNTAGVNTMVDETAPIKIGETYEMIETAKRVGELQTGGWLSPNFSKGGKIKVVSINPTGAYVIPTENVDGIPTNPTVPFHISTADILAVLGRPSPFEVAELTPEQEKAREERKQQREEEQKVQEEEEQKAREEEAEKQRLEEERQRKAEEERALLIEEAKQAKLNRDKNRKKNTDIEIKEIITKKRNNFEKICEESGMTDTSKFRKTRKYQDIYKKAEDVPDDIIPYANNIETIAKGLITHFRFPSKEIADIYTAAWLMEGGSVVLKGVPGTGKTTLIEASTLCFAYPFPPDLDSPDDFAKKLVPDRIEKRYKLMTDGFEEGNMRVRGAGLIGVAKHNPDKMPEDILYYSNIEMVEKVIGEEPKIKVNEPPMLPFELAPGRISKRTKYDFHAGVRSIVTAPIKFQNEANRMSKAVQDAMLGLMAESKVEYMGVEFDSPKKCITLFDYNPHLDRPEAGGQELDIAFLDRIDVGIYLSKPTIYGSRELLKATTVTGRSVKVNVGMAISRKTIDPLSYDELLDVWEMVKLIHTPDRVIEKAVLYCSVLSNTFMKYDPQKYAPKAAIMVPGTGDYKFVDTSTLVYGNDALQHQDKSASVMSGGTSGDTKHQTYLNAIRRPLGFRSVSSLLRLARAYTFLKACQDGTAKRISDIEVSDKTLLMLLPYIADHRINLGVDRDISTSFMNFYDLLTFNIIPKYITTMDEQWDLWLDGMNSATAILEVESNPTPERAYEVFVQEVAKTANIAEAIVKEGLKTEPTYQSIYDILIQSIFGMNAK